LSDVSSVKPKSIYAHDNEEDEWATIMKHDTELFKKEQELEKLRDKQNK